MKKRICTVFFILAGIISAYGIDFSISTGIGGLLGGFFTRYTLSADGKVDNDRIKIDATQEMNQFNYGFLAFIDATYGTFSIYYQNGVNNYNESFEIQGKDNEPPSTGNGWDSYLGFSLMGKYPFILNKRLTVFPLLGIDYQISLKQRRTQPNGWVFNRNDGYRERDKDGNAYKLTDWNSFWINLGGGLDLALAGNFFLRGQFLYSFRTMTPYETKNLDMIKEISGDSSPKLGGLCSGPSLQISAGYKIFTKK